MSTNNHFTLDDVLSGLNPARRAIYDAFVAHGAMTDDELVLATGIKKGTSSPRRGDLVKLGLVEAVGKVDTQNGTKATKWDLVPRERVAEARSTASAKPRRSKPVTKRPLEERLDAVRQLLDMDDVNDAIRGLHGRAWSRVRGRAQDHRGDRNRQQRENDAALREAERRGSPTAEYFKLRRILMQSVERVEAVSRLVAEELERRSSGDQTIPVGAWPAVADLLNDLARTCDDTNRQIRAVMGNLGDDVIEGTVVDIEEFMQLPEGDGDTNMV